MNDVLRERLWRHLDALPEERIYQVLDYVEFLASRYAREPVRPPASAVQRFGERLEDKLRGQNLGLDAIRSTLNAVGTADRMVSGLAEAGRSLLREVGAVTPEARPVEREAAQGRIAPTPPPAPPSRPATDSDETT